MLEKIQRRTTKLIPGLRDLNYRAILKECGIKNTEDAKIEGSFKDIEWS